MRENHEPHADVAQIGRVAIMSMVYFTLVAIVLYLASDWILEQIEVSAGKRFKYRSVIFFVILLTLAVVAFSLIQRYTGNP